MDWRDFFIYIRYNIHMKKPSSTSFLFIFFWMVLYLLFLFIDTRMGQFRELHIYSSIAEKIVSGELPFINFFSEYPPGSVLVFLLPQFFSFLPYQYVFSFCNLLMVLGIIYLGALLVSREKPQLQPKALLVISISFLIMGGLLFNRYDITPVFLTVLGIFLYSKGEESGDQKKKLGAYALITLAGWIKLYSFVVLPFLIIFEWKKGKDWKDIGKYLVVCLGVSLPFFWILYQGQEGVRWFLEYHMGRGLEIESTYSSAVLFLSQIGVLEGVTIIYDYASYGLEGIVPNILAAYSFYLYLLLYLSLLLYAFFDRTRNKLNPSFYLIKYAFLSILVFIITNKVFSTQYILWLLPFMSILPFWFEKQKQKLFFAITFTILVTTTIIFPFGWEIFNKGNLFFTLILLLRNILLISYGVLLLKIHE